MIYLSSYRLGDHAERLRHLEGTGRAGIICNALDVYGDSRLRNWKREAADLEGLGYTCEEIDLRGYFDDHEGLVTRLDELDLVWVVGGNSFVLARAMTASGFAMALHPALSRGLTYAGYSAGACVATPDLRGIELMDEPDALPAGYDAAVPPRTLSLIPYRIVPHWDSDHPETEAAQRAIDWLEREALPYRALRDGEDIIVERQDGQA